MSLTRRDVFLASKRGDDAGSSLATSTARYLMGFIAICFALDQGNRCLSVLCAANIGLALVENARNPLLTGTEAEPYGAAPDSGYTQAMIKIRSVLPITADCNIQTSRCSRTSAGLDTRGEAEDRYGGFAS